ncbi:MAG: succinate dehydrogenase [Desulfobacteraceae bacterium]|nr:MAG: succinate dehydrogenase [Desulfobacteraceae bacterium]
MNWLISTLRSSIGKKLMMAVTGLAFCLFLAAHLAGNLTVFAGPQAFNKYAETLKGLGVIIIALEIGLVIFALVHILTGLTLFYQNLRARPVRYRVNKRAGGRTIGSATMPYTGVILLVFVVIHLANFTFVDKSGTSVYQIVTATFDQWGYILFYIAAMIVAAVHVSHGLWSAFQTLGANHPKYMPAIWVLSIAFALLVGIGFGMLPIYFSISA